MIASPRRFAARATVAEVPYTADYYFWKRTGGCRNAGAHKGGPPPLDFPQHAG